MWVPCACFDGQHADKSTEYLNADPAALWESSPTLLENSTPSRKQRPAGGDIPASPAALPVNISRTRCVSEGSIASTPQGYTGEVAGALNQIVDHLWPRISNYTTHMLLTEVQPQMQANLPKLLDDMSFHPDKCHLGSNPLEFRKIRIDREQQKTAVGGIDNLAIQARFGWDADCNIFLRFPKVPGLPEAGLGIQGLSIHGVLILELVGLFNAPPFFEGVRIFMNKAPDIDVKFEGAAEGLLNFSWVREKIEALVEESIAGPLVLPSRFGYAIAPDADIFRIKAPVSQGMLNITVWEATGLPATERTWLGKPSSDPYVVLKCGATTFQSHAVFKSLKPKWEWTASMLIQEAVHQRIRLDVFNDRTLGTDDFMGRTSLPVSKLLEWGPKDRFTLELSDRAGGQKRGSVTICAEWRPLELDADGTHLDREGVLYAGVHSASRLPKLGEGTVYWVVVTCSHLLKNIPTHPRPTQQVGEVVQGATANEADAEDMEKRLAILRRSNISAEDMAMVLQIEPDRLRASLKKSSSRIGRDLAASRGVHEVTWETPFEFPVESVASAMVSFEVMCKTPGSLFPKSMGVYQTTGASLRSCKNCTEWRTVKVPGTDMTLKLKLGMRFLGSVAAATLATALSEELADA